MKRDLLKKALIFILLLGLTNVSAQLYNFSDGLQGWSVPWGDVTLVSHNATEGVSGDGALQLARTTNNSGFGLANGGIDADAKKFVRMRYKNESNATSFRFQGKNSSDVSIAQTVFSIGANSDEYITGYFDLTGVTGWSGLINDLDILVRVGYVAGEGLFLLDEIEFLDAMPPTEYSEFIQNPSFDGPSGISHLTGAKAFVTRGITSVEQHDGTQSLKLAFTGDADAIFWTFSNYEKIYTSKFNTGSELEIKMWVKTNRSAPISMSARCKLTDAGDDSQAKPIVSVTTTNTTMDWEELTFTLTSQAAFDGATFWFSINWEDGVSTNLLNGDIVYIDQLSAIIKDGATAINDDQQLEGVSVYPNPAISDLNIEAPQGAQVEICNIAGTVVKSFITTEAISNILVSDLVKGMYLVKATANGRTTIKKVLVK